MRVSVVAAVVATCIALPAFPRHARADKAVGLALYDDADALTKSGNWAVACEKLAASQKEYPRPVTLLRLGDCYERIGKTASAWISFREAALTAKSAQSQPEFDAAKEKAREQEALKRRDAAEKKLTRVKIVISAPATGLIVKRDGREVSSAELGSALPLDPGTVTLEATAPGFVSWTEKRELVGEGRTIEIVVPALKPEARPEPQPEPKAQPKPELGPQPQPQPGALPPKPDAPPTGDGGTQRAVGLTLGAVGVVTGVVGAYVGIKAKSDRDAVGCNDAGTLTCPDDAATGRYNDANGRVKVGWTVAGIGAAVAVTGVILFVAAPSAGGAKAASRGPSMAVGTTGTGVFLRGEF
jgi:hypothetical protein